MKRAQLMFFHSLWTKLFAPNGGAACGSRLRRKSYNQKRAYKAERYGSENERGNPAPPPRARDAIVTTGSA